MKCKVCTDQWESDADREPYEIVEDWESWHYENKPDFDYEVYEIINNRFERIKDYDEHLEHGMVFYYIDENDKTITIRKYEDKKRTAKIPVEVIEAAKKCNFDIEGIEGEFDSLKREGAISWEDEDNGGLYVYGEYNDHHYSTDW